METFLEEIKKEAHKATVELLEQAHLSEGDILVVGCSSSEVMGKRIGTSGGGDHSSEDEPTGGRRGESIRES